MQRFNPDVLMKDSGVPWIGEIPAHWELHQLRRLVKSFIDYRGRTPAKDTEGRPLITAGAIRDGVIDHDRCPEWVSDDEYAQMRRRGIPQVGDLLFTSEAPLGEVGVIEDAEIACAQRIILLRPDKSRVNSEFLKYHFLAGCGKDEVRTRQSGSTAPGIRADRFRASLVPTPPLEEQRAICSNVVERTKSAPAVESRLSQQVAKLHRQALITAAVTGQLDIPEATA